MIGWDDPDEIQDSGITFEELVQLGGEFPPTYAEGGSVITPRLREKLTPMELRYWSSKPLEKYFYGSLIHVVGWDLIDGWDVHDFVGLALEVAHENPEWENWQVVGRVRDRVTDRRRRASLIRMRGLPEQDFDEDSEPEIRASLSAPEASPYAAPEFVPRVLPADAWVWIQDRLSTRTAEAVRLCMEEGYTQAEAADHVGISRRTVIRGINTLRSDYGVTA